MLESANEKQGSRRSSDSAGSDFSLWSDTGDLAEQLADQEDPLQIDLRKSVDNEAPGGSGSRPRERPAKRVHYSQQDHLHRKNTNPGISKEAIQIPEPTARHISQTEKVVATIMSGDRQASHMHGLTGKPLLYAPTATGYFWEVLIWSRYFTSVFVSLGVFLFGYDQGVMSGIITYGVPNP